MGLRYRTITGILVAGVLVAGVTTAAAQSEPGKPKVLRWESNLSLGYLDSHHLGIVKSFWWFAVPNIISLGPSFDYVGNMLSIAVNVAVTAPLPTVRPFVCAGVGGSLSSGSLTSCGGGLKIRLGRRFGVVAEYRRYRYDEKISWAPPIREKISANYLGFGIHWVY